MLGDGRGEKKPMVGLKHSLESPCSAWNACPFFKGLTGRLVASKTSSQFSRKAQPTGGGTERKDKIEAQTSQGTLSPHKLTWKQMKNKMTK